MHLIINYKGRFLGQRPQSLSFITFFFLSRMSFILLRYLHSPFCTNKHSLPAVHEMNGSLSFSARGLRNHIIFVVYNFGSLCRHTYSFKGMRVADIASDILGWLS